MDILKAFSDEIIGFLGIGNAWEILQSGDSSVLASYKGMLALVCDE